MTIDYRDVVDSLMYDEVYQEGQFILKSGKTTDHYYDMGKINCNYSITGMANWLLRDVIGRGMGNFNVIFTSAYKGIIISTAMVCECKECFPIDIVRLGYLRKEVKDHGDKNNVVGYCPHEKDKVLLVDDVLSSGRSLKEMVDFVRKTGAEIVGAQVVVNRMSIDETIALEKELSIPEIGFLITDDLFQVLRKPQKFNSHEY